MDGVRLRENILDPTQRAEVAESDSLIQQTSYHRGDRRHLTGLELPRIIPCYE